MQKSRLLKWKLQNMPKKDYFWTFKGKEYVVRNLPFTTEGRDYEELYDVETMIKMAMIRDLMYMKKIPNDIDFEDIADKLSFN